MPIRTPHPSPLPARGEGGERVSGDRPRNLETLYLAQPQDHRFTSKRSLDNTPRSIDDDIDLRVLAGLELRSVLYHAPECQLRAPFLDLVDRDDTPESGQTNVALCVRVACQNAGGHQSSSPDQVNHALHQVRGIAR